MTWAELAMLDNDLSRIEPTIQWIDSEGPNSPGGATLWYGHEGPHEALVYSDSLFGAPVFAMLYKLTGERRFLEIMNASFDDVTAKLLDPEEDLYYRDRTYIGKYSPNGKKILWSRGNGWVFAGLARILTHLPRSEPEYDRYLDLFRRMAASLAARQHADGLWRSNLGDPEHFLMPESSGTAFFTFGFAWGINNGVLPKETYLPVVIKGWSGLLRCIHPEGKLGWVQPVDAAPRPSLPTTTHEYATGLFLLAGSEVLKLVESGILTPESAAPYEERDDSILPPQTYNPRLREVTRHPLAATIETFLANQKQVADFQPTGLSRDDYLEVIAGQVTTMSQYQDADGRIIDPHGKREKYYSTPCFAHAVAVLAHAGYPISEALLESGMRALDVSIRDLFENTPADRHGDFFTWPVTWAWHLFQPFASAERKARWQEQLAAMPIEKVYSEYKRPFGTYEHREFYNAYGKSWSHNWNIVNATGEGLRAIHGLTSWDYTDFSLTMQTAHFTPFGMYQENGDPLAYDLFARHYIAALLELGYRSFTYTTYRPLLWRGAWTSLFMQSPTGELPTGYRSSQHIWNEAEEAVLFEIYASEYAKIGRLDEAGAFKRAARLALRAIKDWIRDDGTGYVVKNRYPIEARHGFERYTYHTCYNLLACSMLAQAWYFADDSIEERPSPADTGGFAVVVPAFHKVFLNAGGTYIEYDTAGDLKYTPTGLIRVHLRHGHPQLGPSDGTGVGGANVYLEKASWAPENLAVGPSWRRPGSAWVRLAGRNDTHPAVQILEESPEKVQARIVHTIPGETPEQNLLVSETITVEPDAVTVQNQFEGADLDAVRVSFPMLVFDGRDETVIQAGSNTVTLQAAGRQVTFTVIEPEGLTLQRSGLRMPNRNGMVEEISAESTQRQMIYRITSD